MVLSALSAVTLSACSIGLNSIPTKKALKNSNPSVEEEVHGGSGDTGDSGNSTSGESTTDGGMTSDDGASDGTSGETTGGTTNSGGGETSGEATVGSETSGSTDGSESCLFGQEQCIDFETPHTITGDDLGGNGFGERVAIDKDYAVIANEDIALYKRTSNGDWIFKSSIDLSAAPNSGSQTLAIKEKTVAVSLRGSGPGNDKPAKVEVYQIDPSDELVLDETFSGSHADYFGYGHSIALGKNLNGEIILAIGSRDNGLGDSSVEIKRRVVSGPFGQTNSWFGGLDIVPPGANPDYGHTVALHNNVLVVAEHFSTTDDKLWLVYLEEGSFTSVPLEKPADLSPDTDFGRTIAVSESTIVVGVPSNGEGRVYTYQYSAEFGALSVDPPVVLPVPSGAFALSPGATFGADVDIYDDTIVVSEPGLQTGLLLGSDYIYLKENGDWVFEALTPFPSLSGANSAQLGFSCAISQDSILLGAPGTSGIGQAVFYGYKILN